MNQENMARLKRPIAQMEAAGGTIHGVVYDDKKRSRDMITVQQAYRLMDEIDGVKRNAAIDAMDETEAKYTLKVILDVITDGLREMEGLPEDDIEYPPHS